MMGTTRRRFLGAIVATAGCLAVSAVRRLLGVAATAAADDGGPQLTPRVYIPLVHLGVPGSGVKAVHVHHAKATHWDFSTGWYGSYVRQGVVDSMMEEGLMRLTDTALVEDAWTVLLSDYEPGQKIAVKVNLNNSTCGDTDNQIDALIEPVNALIRSLVTAGIAEEDVWVYDAIRSMPQRFYGRREFTEARFFGNAGCADAVAPFGRGNRSLRVAFSHPALRSERWLTSLLGDATYVINMPILKRHGAHPVSLGFKNHFGSLNDLGGDGDDNPHPYIDPGDGRYSTNSSPLVDIYANPNIADKTVLTVGDGLFGASGCHHTPAPWSTFGDRAPNSLLFSRDPVAIDCVMCDLLAAEWGVDDAAYDYLQLAEARGLGLFEKGDPWGSGYTRFHYMYER
jgi:hypothetical protein